MKGILLLSGGIDSPVAGYLMKQRGCEIVSLHFSNEPFADEGAREKSEKIAKMLGLGRLTTIPFGNTLAEIVKKCRHKYYYVLSRRLMLRIAEKMAEKEKADFIITGDDMGQVGSQTLSNMSVISHAVKIPIHRPLLSYDKNEIIKIARKIETFDISSGPEMCSVLGPKHPATHSDIETIQEEEKNFDVEEYCKSSLSLINQ